MTMRQRNRYLAACLTINSVSFLQILAPELNDRLLADFLDMESSLIVSMHDLNCL